MAKKRGNNEGNINQRKDGRWEARITTGYKDGKQIRKCIYGKTRQEVATKLSVALAQVQRGQTLPDESITVKAFLDSWLEGTAKARLRANTYNRYKQLITLHICPMIGREKIARLSPQMAQRLWTDLQRNGLSARTVIQVRAILRVALNQAVRHGLTQQNAAALSDAPKAIAFKPTFLNPEQAETLLAKVKDHRLEALVTLALTTGMRIGEVLGLTWGDIDLEGKSLAIRQQQQRVGKELTVCAPKTERSSRSIPLTQMAVDSLQRHRDMQVALIRDRMAEGHILSGRVFTNEKGAPLENSTVLRQFQRLVDEAKLPRMRLHDLRHSCATLLLSKGVHPRVVMEILGHSTIAMTMNVYSHVVPEIARDAANAMESVFAPKAAKAEAQ
ncbi:MAG: site-specific integrase [Chlorobia bacterium]|nr:site-specific integrase [Fimbriimonadaceae bacterium]